MTALDTVLCFVPLCSTWDRLNGKLPAARDRNNCKLTVQWGSMTWRLRYGARHGALLRSAMFDLGSTQRQVARGSEPEQLQADRSIGLDKMATSSTRRRRDHDGAKHGALLRPIVFD